MCKKSDRRSLLVIGIVLAAMAFVALAPLTVLFVVGCDSGTPPHLVDGEVERIIHLRVAGGKKTVVTDQAQLDELLHALRCAQHVGWTRGPDAYSELLTLIEKDGHEKQLVVIRGGPYAKIWDVSTRQEFVSEDLYQIFERLFPWYEEETGAE